MYLLENGTVVYSATDLSAAATCEWAVMRGLDARLGRIPKPPQGEDEMLRRAAVLGDAHEQKMLDRLRAAGPIVEIERPDPQRIAEAAAETRLAFEAGADAVYQAAFFDGRFLGYADFILRSDDGSYEVYDTKLARHAKVTALLQLAAYSEQLQLLGIPVGERVYLLLGDNTTSEHRLRDILPVYRKRRARLEQIIDERVADNRETPWGDPRYAACGRCEACDEQVQLHRDVLLVAGLRATQRARLVEAGILTIDSLADSTGPVEGMADRSLEALREQARLQLAPPEQGAPLPWKVANGRALAAIPLPNPGDIFFDFEGDPLYQEGDAWNLDYLFGLVEPDEKFRAFWAHDLAGEKQALLDFLDYVAERRTRFPGMHIYHYASYERTHLLSIAARHGAGEAAVDGLLRANVLVDLYPIVRHGVRVGSRSYSLKKLEPLYMGDRLRAGVDNAADSITEYVRAMDLRESGDIPGSDAVLQEISDYNEYDCVSTLKLRDWLLERARESGVVPASADQLELLVEVPEPDPVYLELADIVAGFPVAERTADQQALALASAAIDYHRREGKSFWWEHYARLVAPLDDWAESRGVFVVEAAEVVRDWSIIGKDNNASRMLRLTGTPAPGSSFGGSDSPFAVFDEPYPPVDKRRDFGARAAHGRTGVEIDEHGVFLLTEKLPNGGMEYDQLPIALTPSTPPPGGSQVTAISEWGRRVLDSLPHPIPDPAMDILRRQPPRGAIAAAGDDFAAAITATVLGLDHSYLAVQGPPGTGKTYNGARVIADLVANYGWKVGVVAQSHATVENMLQAVIDAGLDPSLIGKRPKGDDLRDVPWTKLGRNDDFARREGGLVMGGTAWTFSNANTVPRASFDLLVIDEAGQFSLASTIASSVAATRLLLLGDPQQLPQVSQGMHPEPVDMSALGWLSEGHDVLPPELGYFLAKTRRMHPALTRPVSRLSYEGRLESAAPERHLDGIEPGLHPVPVDHWQNSTSSAEEAIAVLGLMDDLVGRSWTTDGRSEPIRPEDIIVVAPYNAQVDLLRETLDAAGYVRTPVGTVDKFQGREAAISIVSLAASSPADVPRGIEFLLLANRLNVALSRAQWASFLVYSPQLTEYLPRNAAALAQLSAFIELAQPA